MAALPGRIWFAWLIGLVHLDFGRFELIIELKGLVCNCGTHISDEHKRGMCVDAGNVKKQHDSSLENQSIWEHLGLRTVNA